MRGRRSKEWIWFNARALPVLVDFGSTLEGLNQLFDIEPAFEFEPAFGKS